MRNKLKQFRVQAGMTQTQIAKAVSITQPSYQRWESGSSTIPEDKLKKLAKVLKTSPEALLGNHAPIKAAFYDDSAPDELNYYGEVAIHFLGGGDPLLLSISEAEFEQLHRSLQEDTPFVSVESLANQTVILRVQAISDLYFSSEAYDDYGPEHGAYANHVSVQIPDSRDWEIIEAIAADDVGIEDFPLADVQRIRDMIMTTDEQYERLLAEGHIAAEDLEKERAERREETEMILAAASTITYQLSTGKRRSVPAFEPARIFEAFYELTDFGGDTESGNLIRLALEGRHRIIFINKSGLDYVSLPTHLYDEGRIEVDAEDLDSGEESRSPLPLKYGAPSRMKIRTAGRS